MKSRPILFTPENAQKVHDGTKTQTRRIVKPDPPAWVKEWGYTCFTPKGNISGRGTYEDKGPAEKFFKCPYGVVGDRLWCREAFTATREGKYVYRGWEMFKGMKEFDWTWTPSLHMPRKACRTWLELTAVRVERLQDITEDDARAEGCAPVVHEDGAVDCGTRKTIFRQLWESIHGPGSWDRNDWVWVLEFQRVQP